MKSAAFFLVSFGALAFAQVDTCIPGDETCPFTTDPAITTDPAVTTDPVITPTLTTDAPTITDPVTTDTPFTFCIPDDEDCSSSLTAAGITTGTVTGTDTATTTGDV